MLKKRTTHAEYQSQLKSGIASLSQNDRDRLFKSYQKSSVKLLQLTAPLTMLKVQALME